jgi:2,4-dienoyl-CoA reductase-like NADH-dependent reductase (Old Yellow Enzyme family)
MSNPSQHLFEPFQLRGLALPNRIVVSPMGTSSSGPEGLASDWNLVHLGAFAAGGAGLVIQEATAVSRQGRHGLKDLGLWSDDQIEPLSRITRYLHGQGAASAVQISHAGRKAGIPKVPSADAYGWVAVAPSAIPFSPNHAAPRELDAAGIREAVGAFRDAARRAHAAGFSALEIHAAHGYLIHQFLSPLSNRREDAYGGGFAGRIRFAREVTQAVRTVWPEAKPLLIRISATDWAEGGWSADESVELARVLKGDGADLIDVSSGGAVPDAKIPVGPGYQSAFSERIRREAGIATGAVGLIGGPGEADDLVRSGKSDLVFLARNFLKDPFWALHAAEALGRQGSWPKAYLSAAPAGSRIREPLGA